MERILLTDLENHIEKKVLIMGSINIRRDHGKLIFFEIRDLTGKLQVVILPSHPEVHQIAQTIRPEWSVQVLGTVHERPRAMVKEGEQNGTLELEAEEITILSKAQELPFERGADVGIETYLDHLPFTLRAERPRAIFKIQATIVQAFREFFNHNLFTEIQAPKIIGEDAEGGAQTFKTEYFGYQASLAQSPQFYKQIMVGVYERVFAIGNVYRAELHSTSRHLNEYTSLDAEMGFISDYTDITNIKTQFLHHLNTYLEKHVARELKLLNATLPDIPKQIPQMKLREAQALIEKETGQNISNEPDLEPQHERWIGTYAKEKLNSDFIFITHFPLSKRPMYTYEDPHDPGYAGGFDLLFRGLEITTGGQRIHDYEQLLRSMEKKKLDPQKFSFYLQAFKYGMPPHGGFGTGLERLTARLLGIENVKEASLFPRDIHRIDTLLHS